MIVGIARIPGRRLAHIAMVPAAVPSVIVVMARGIQRHIVICVVVKAILTAGDVIHVQAMDKNILDVIHVGAGVHRLVLTAQDVAGSGVLIAVK